MIMSNAGIIWFYSLVIKFKRLLVLAHLPFWNYFLVSLNDGDIYWFKLPSDWKGLFHGTESGYFWRKFQCGNSIHSSITNCKNLTHLEAHWVSLGFSLVWQAWNLWIWVRTEPQVSKQITGTARKSLFCQGFELKWPGHHFLVSETPAARSWSVLVVHAPCMTLQSMDKSG